MYAYFTRRVVLLALAVSLCGCSFIRFERGPYAVRGLEVVYSEQEDLTFFVWRLRDDADPDRVRFDLWINDEYRPIDLDSAPFPATPYQCGDFLCYQYQVNGRYEPPEEVDSPLNSYHEDEGLFAGSTPRYRTAPETFRADPLGLDNNRSIDAGIWSWFAENEVPMRREFQWQFVDRPDPDCGEPDAADWKRIDSPMNVDHEWVETPRCFASRPDRKVGEAAVYMVPIEPSAETLFEQQTYIPRKETSPIVYGILVDLEIANRERCAQIKSDLIESIEANFEARGDAERLSVYTPLSPDTGLPADGCDQDPRQDYPVELMIRDAEQATAAVSPKRVRVVWVYINNIELPPGERVIQQLVQLGEQAVVESNLDIFTWAIGSNAILSLFPWNETTGWRPIDDKTFQADIESVAKNNLPFLTMDHTDQTEVSIETPGDAEEPSAFKVCSATPVQYDRIGTVPGAPFPVYDVEDPAVPWPMDEDILPYYTVPLEPQILVPNASYVRRRVDIVVEVCTRFCSNAFRTRGGATYDNWSATPGPRALEVCQWRN